MRPPTPKLHVFVYGLFALALVSTASPALATSTFSIDIVIISDPGNFAGTTGPVTGVGSFEVDTSLAAPVGFSDVDLSAFDFTLDRVTWGLFSSDLPGPDSHEAHFLDGSLVGVNFRGVAGGSGGSGTYLSLESDGSFRIGIRPWGDLSAATMFRLRSPTLLTAGTYAPAPEPSAALLFGLGFGLVGWITRRHTRD